MERDWRDFKSLKGGIEGAREAFEKACESLIRKIHPDKTVQQVRVKLGDGGIDVYVGELGVEPITVYQCKFFLDVFDTAQHAQIRDSFSTAIQSTNFELKNWVLCIPKVLDIDETKWWTKWKNKQITNFNKDNQFITLVNGNELIDLMKTYGVYNLVFEIEELTLTREIHKNVAQLTQTFNSEKELPKKRQYKLPENYIIRKLVDNDNNINFYYNKGETLESIIKKENNVALIGWAGTGKSTELEFLAYKLSFPTEIFYPFHIKLNIHTEKAIKNYISEIDKVPQNLIVVLLDGLDEVQAGSFDTVSRRIQEFNDEFPEAKIIVSCRSNFYTTIIEDNKLNSLKGFKSYYLSKLSYEDIISYLQNKIPLKVESFLTEINSKKLENLLSIPYYLIKLSEQYSQNNNVSNSKAELFEEVISSNIKKDVTRYFTSNKESHEKKMRNLLEKLAFILEYQGKNHCSWADIITIFENENDLNMIKSSASLLNGSEGLESTWQFNHNNIQEYLSAKVLSRLKFIEIKNLITFKPDFSKVKPTWVNTISFLITILDKNSKTRNDLISMLTKNEPELIIKFEPDKLDSQIKFEVFKNIFNYYKKEERWINRTKFNSLELSKFSMTEQTLMFLIQEMQLHQPENSISNALGLIVFFDLETEFLNQKNEVKKLIENRLFNNKIKSSQLEIRAYLELFTLSLEEFKKLISKYSNYNDSFIRYTLFSGIHKQGYQDEYIDFVIEQIQKLMANEMNERETLSNENYELNECIKTVKTQSSFIKILDFLANDYGKVASSIYFTEIIQNTLISISKLFPNDVTLFEKVKNLFTIDSNALHGEKTEKFIDFFDTMDSRLKVFKEMYESINAETRYYTFRKLAHLANEDCVVFLANEFKVGAISKEFVFNFQHHFNKYDDHQLLFNKLVNEVEPIELPAYRDIEKEKNIRNERTKELLFDVVKFKNAIEQLFIDAGKDELTYEEIWEIHKTEWEGKYLPIVYSTTRIYNKDETRNRFKLLEWLDKAWDWYSISKIIEFIKDVEDPSFTKEQNEYIINWCNETVKHIDFKTALTYPDENSTSADRKSIWLSFLLRHFNLIKYNQEIYLDLLSFCKWSERTEEVDIFDFVETIIPNDQINHRVLRNLSEGIQYYLVLENHLNYCIKNNLRQASKLFVNYLKNKHNSRHKILDAFIQLEGDIKQLEDLVMIIQDDFKFEIIKILIKVKSSMIERHILTCFNSENDDFIKLKYSNFLIQLQNKTGLEYYIKYVKKHKHAPDIHHMMSPFEKISSISLMDNLFELYELGFSSEIKKDNFNNIQDIAIGAIQNVSLFEENFSKSKKIFYYYKLKFKLLQKIGVNKKPIDIILKLNYFYENIEQRYYINKSTNVDLKEAVLNYSLLN